MMRLTISFVVAGAALLLSADIGAAETLSEVEHARGLARAGRYITDQDAELLDRWGDHSGSPRVFYDPYPPPYHPPRRRYYAPYPPPGIEFYLD